MRTLLSVSSLWRNSVVPAPAGHHSTRQWLARSASVLPPSWLRRTNEFSPVMRTSLGSTGFAMTLLVSGGGRYLDARVVVAGALADVGVRGRGQRGDRLAVVGGT